MDLYKRALKLEYIDTRLKNKWVLCPGAFHTVLCALRCLCRTIEGSGLDEAWQEADTYRCSPLGSEYLNLAAMQIMGTASPQSHAPAYL